MRKAAVVFLALTLLMMFTMSMSVAYATPPAPASGDWTYTPTIIDQRWADDNQFVYGEEVSTWKGTFLGTSDDVFTVIKHEKVWNVKGLIDFTGTVNGKSGTMVISFVGKLTPPPGEWSGQWVILSGTGDLANLHGQGTWWGPPKNVDYSGQIHFD